MVTIKDLPQNGGNEIAGREIVNQQIFPEWLPKPPGDFSLTVIKVSMK